MDARARVGPCDEGVHTILSTVQVHSETCEGFSSCGITRSAHRTATPSSVAVFPGRAGSQRCHVSLLADDPSLGPAALVYNRRARMNDPTAVPAAVAFKPDSPALTRRVALAIYTITVVVYAVFAGDRMRTHSPDNHFAYLADSYLHGTLAVRCPPAMAHPAMCPPGGGGNDWAHFGTHWYVAFPSFPAVVYLPAVALLGRDFPNRAMDVLLAGVAPALLFLFLQQLRTQNYSTRSLPENAGLTALFAFGTVYFFSAVQGSVWFTAHVVGCALAVGFLRAGLEARRPLLAGVLLGLAFHTRTSMLLLAPFFAVEAIRVHRRTPDASVDNPPRDPVMRLLRWFMATAWPGALRAMALFALPVAVSIALYMALNQARFHSPTDPGYQYLQIRWQARILRWGLFNYHYLSRNLAVCLALLPWITRTAPFVQVSRHRLALWVTTPQYLELSRPARRSPLTPALTLAAASVALIDILYQNSGWVQFGYRFSNDFAVPLIVLLALTGRPWRRWGWALLALAIVVNAFGAATFDRANSVYAGDNTADGMFQPD